MKAGAGSITIDYGRPSLKGQDRLAQLKVGDAWRMGSEQATVITTPVDLVFGATKVPKGSYSLFTLSEPTRKSLEFWFLILKPGSGA